VGKVAISLEDVCAHNSVLEVTVMIDRFKVFLSEQGQAVSIGALAALFGAAVLLGFL
jgi:hypothetical protein